MRVVGRGSVAFPMGSLPSLALLLVLHADLAKRFWGYPEVVLVQSFAALPGFHTHAWTHQSIGDYHQAPCYTPRFSNVQQ